jgi:predicted glycosyltransferase/nucleoside-diphosphate-sugar epimerase
MAKVLVTGAAGFIGSHLSESLVRLGWSVRGLDAFTGTYPPRLKRANVRGLLCHPRFELINADLTIADLAGVLDGVDVVAHLAGEAGVTSSWGSEFSRYLRRNVLATQRLLEAARVRGVERIVYASSSSVYGGHERPSTASLPRPVSPYGASKLAGESLVSAYAQGYGVPAVCLRYFSVYGPRQRPDMAAHRFIEAALDKRPLIVYGDGKQARDFTYVDDVVAATVAALEADLEPGRVLDVGSGRPLDVATLVDTLRSILGLDITTVREPERPGDVGRTESHAGETFTALGWTPVTDIHTGLTRQVEWHLLRRDRGQLHVLKRPAGPPADRLKTQPVAGLGTSHAAQAKARPARSGEPRLLIYSQDGLGLGHLRRTTLLASEFLRARPGASALTIADSPLGQFFTTEGGHDYLKLPSIRKAAPGEWHPVSLSASFDDVLGLRRELIRSAVVDFRPDILLVDHMPHGAMGELLPALRALTGWPVRVVLGLRDILDAPGVIRDTWNTEGAYDAVEQHYDDVLVYGSRELFDVSERYGWPSRLAGRLRYCGYVCSPPSGKLTGTLRRRHLRGSPAGHLIVATAGGGGDAFPLFDTLLQALPGIRAVRPLGVVVITGPFMPPEEQKALTRRARPLGVGVLRTVTDMGSYIGAADLVVAMAGYNTTAEVLSSGTPALLVPRKGPSAEQRTRAQLFAERGWVHWLPPERLEVAALSQAVLDCLADPARPGPGNYPDLRGRQVAADLLLAALDDVRSAPPTAPGNGSSGLTPSGSPAHQVALP